MADQNRCAFGDCTNDSVASNPKFDGVKDKHLLEMCLHHLGRFIFDQIEKGNTGENNEYPYVGMIITMVNHFERCEMLIDNLEEFVSDINESSIKNPEMLENVGALVTYLKNTVTKPIV